MTCECGCGETVGLARCTDKRWGLIKGQPTRFIQGHGHGRRHRVGPPYVVDDDTGCWVFQGRSRSGKYGTYGLATGVDGRRVRAHRLFYERYVGPIPDGHDLHHRCGNTLCVNPEHLEPMTRAAHRQLH